MINFTKRGKAKQAFLSRVKGKNFMTPYVIGYAVINTRPIVVELSEGETENHSPMFSLTIVSLSSGKTLERLFTSRKGAEKYAEKL